MIADSTKLQAYSVAVLPLNILIDGKENTNSQTAKSGHHTG
jgi:hypothetical protein